jgi:hypothetical protein
VSGEPARFIELTIPEASQTYRARAIVFARDGWVDVITLTTLPDSYKSSLPALDSLVRSWQWT